MAECEPDNPSVQLARRAAAGDATAQREINALIHPIITYQTSRFCKRFCQENRYRYICTLEASINARSNLPEGAVFCEWGNASYGWMLDDLVNRRRLERFEGKNGAQVNHYLYQIANSLPFYERWKDWRFGQKVHVPTYIQSLHPLASELFLGLRRNEALPLLAQKLGLSEADARRWCKEIMRALTQKKRLHLLDPPHTVSLASMATAQDDEQQPAEMEIASEDEPAEDRQQKQLLRKAWAKLSAVEQFVLEAMLIEEQDARDILLALKKMQISLKPGVPAEETTAQQLYYFRRKALAKLADLMQKP